MCMAPSLVSVPSSQTPSKLYTCLFEKPDTYVKVLVTLSTMGTTLGTWKFDDDPDFNYFEEARRCVLKELHPAEIQCYHPEGGLAMCVQNWTTIAKSMATSKSQLLPACITFKEVPSDLPNNTTTCAKCSSPIQTTSIWINSTTLCMGCGSSWEETPSDDESLVCCMAN